jgi:hypothetical protein
MNYFGNPAKTYQRRELRELFKLRRSLGEQYQNDPLGYEYEGQLGSFAQTQPFGASEMKGIDREIQSTTAAESLAGRRMIEQDLASMGIQGGDRAQAIQSEMDRTRGLLASMAKVQAGNYAATQNIQQLEQSRQALAGAMSDRYGTLATILGAGVQ